MTGHKTNKVGWPALGDPWHDR